eukprot:g15619.t1
MKPARRRCGLLRCAPLLSILATAKSQQLLPCALGVTSTTVTTSAQAADLADALFCSGGQFEVTWVGEVLLNSALTVSGGTFLKVTGSSSVGGVVDGGAQTQLFNVSGGSTLELQGLSLVNGVSSSGGGAVGLSDMSSLAIANCSFEGNTDAGADGGGALFAYDGSTVTVEGETAFTNNIATSFGGAILVYTFSNVTIGGETTFNGNTAGLGGGAIYAGAGNLVTVGGETTFVNNVAEVDGGAMYWYNSNTVTIGGETTFNGNTAGLGGGAIFAEAGNLVTIGGETTFVNNVADDGGAIYWYNLNTVTIGGETTFVNNNASFNGGAMNVNLDNHVAIGGETTFANNNASLYGGAILAVDSHVTLGGETTFVRNVADSGGAILLYDYGTMLTEDGTAFVNNSALEDGGAICVTSNSTMTIGGETSFVNNEASSGGGGIYASLDSNVAVGGETTFANNSAYAGGGIHMIYESAVTINGITAFEDNSAGGTGGAIYVNTNSNVTAGGETTFVTNRSGRDGGAIFAIYGSSVAVGDETTFIGNIADTDGGAFFVHTECSVTIAGTTAFTDNTAGFYGGAMYMTFYNIVTVGGGTTFIDNRAGAEGGGIHMLSGGMVLIAEETTFVNNSASSGGGINILTDSHVILEGKTTFADNVASRDGGAIGANSQCSLAIGGETTFENNRAGTSGGALFVSSDSNMTISGDTSFTDNNSGEDGGALFCQDSNCLIDSTNMLFTSNSAGGDGGAISAANGATLSIRGAVLLQDNTAENNGGAVSSFSGTITTEEGSTFSNNTAIAGAGGGLYCSTCVANFTGGIFTANRAVWGGGMALFSTGSAWSEAEPDTSGPTNTTGCTFQHNNATDGGGIYSAAGYDIIRDCRFEANFATGSGGAYLHSGVAVDLDRCTFVGNKAGEEGLAVLSLGIAENISDAEFDSNSFFCSTGTYGYEMEQTEAEVSDTCRFDVVCARCGSTTCQETPGTVINSTLVPTCQPMMTGADSTSNAGATLQTLDLEPGYYRTSPTSRDVLECHREEACIGGNDASQYCAEGYQGAYCAVCEEDYGSGYQFSCHRCVDQDAGSVATAVTVLVVVVLVIALAIADLVAVVEQDDTASSWANRLKSYRNRLVEAIPLTAIKIVLVAWQIITQFTTVADVMYPDVYEDFLSLLNLVNFDLGLIPTISCVVNIDFYARLLFATMAPLAVLAVLALTHTVARSRNRHSPAALKAVKGKHLSVALFVMFIVYSSVSFTVFQTFGCETLDDGVKYLRADYSLTCSTSAHTAWRAYAGLMIFVYPVGIPAIFAWWLISNRRDLQRVGVGDSSISERLEPMRDLWEPYKPRRYYYEVVECGRRIALTGLGVFLFPGSTAQVALELIFAAAFIAISDILSPFADPMDAWLYRSGMWVVYLSMFLALLIKVDVSDEDSQSQHIFAILLIAANACLILAIVVQAMVTLRKELGVVVAHDQPVAHQSSRSLSFAQMFDGESDGDDNGGTVVKGEESATVMGIPACTTRPN